MTTEQTLAAVLDAEVGFPELMRHANPITEEEIREAQEWWKENERERHRAQRQTEWWKAYQQQYQTTYCKLKKAESCKKCYQKRKAKVKAYYQTPEAKSRHREACRAYHQSKMDDPEYRAKRAARERARRLAIKNKTNTKEKSNV